MDAKTRTLISLYGLDGSYLAVGGGAGKYVVYISTVEEEFWNLLKQHSEKNGIVMLNAGGQDGDYPSRQVVDKESALRAAKTFFRTGNRDASLSWEKQG
jgi:hypothetical protein